ncbi:hypothetical protein [Bosea sp. WAO]|uniref:hypothetical protein n=1 Tax=Bosea sp. WAO TaxID=406341 RepID=UPI000AEFBC16|nr:hypothetical protein [Bosea sp. WAO]
MGNLEQKKPDASDGSDEGNVSFAHKLFAAAAGQWSGAEQGSIMAVLKAWMKMIEEELREKQRTILDIFSRINVHDDEIAKRVKTSEYQSLLRKSFRNWSGTESEKKQDYVRNILCNAASTRIVSDDVVGLFIDWLQKYSEFHFAVIGELYRNPGSTRGEIWGNLGKGDVREDSADADLFKLLVRDLSTGGIIRQHRETDYAGNFIAKRRSTPVRHANNRQLKSAFDETEAYELTALGKQFVHYAMTELTVKIQYQPAQAPDATEPQPIH